MANKGEPFSDNDVANPRITFHAPGKTFDRLLKERSLSNLKETVQKKLGLGPGSVVQLTQLHNDQLVDLEDEDDFDAFCAIANEQRHATLQVALTENYFTEGSTVNSKGSMSPLSATPASALPSYGRLPTNSSAFIPGGTALHKKFVVINEDGIEVNPETLTIKVSPILPTASVTVRQNLPPTPTRKTVPIRIETPEQREQRLEEEEKERVNEEEKERLRRQEEEEEKERVRKENEARELRRKERKQKKMEHLRREKEEKRRREQKEQNATNAWTSTETSSASSPATRPSPLSSWTSINQTTQHPPPSTQSLYSPFIPNSCPHQQQNTGPGSGSPAYPRQLNGNGPRSPPGPSASPQVPPAMSSPRLEAHPSTMPPPPPPPMTAEKQPPVPWPGYHYPGAKHQHQHYMQTYQGWNWAPPHMSPATQHPPQHPPSDPDTSGVPMSSRTHAPPLQSPGTPTLAHAAPVLVSHHAPLGSMSSMSSPYPTPASALPYGRLNPKSSVFVPGAIQKKVVLKNEDGIEVNLETLMTKVSPTPPRKTVPIRLETPEQRQKRLEEEKQKEKEVKAKTSEDKEGEGGRGVFDSILPLWR